VEITWGPDGFLWVTERVGKRVVRVNPADGSKSVAVTIGEVSQTLSQDGLLGMALHPDLLRRAGRDYVYLAYTYNAGTEAKLDRRMKIRRYTYDAASHQLGEPMDILLGLPHGTDHGAGRLVFGPDAKLYLSRGDHGSNFLANYCDVNRAQDTRPKMRSAGRIGVRIRARFCGSISMARFPRTIPSFEASEATSILMVIEILKGWSSMGTSFTRRSTAKASTTS
jgi:glucose/arabinose dehydrogenase